MDSIEIKNEISKLFSIEKRTDPNDKINKKFFNMNDDQYNANKLFISEKIFKNKETGKTYSKEILTPISLEFSEYTRNLMKDKPAKFNAFDREVCFACISEQTAGNKYTTVDIIYRNMTGSDGRRRPKPQMIELIKASLSKLFFSEVTIDLTEVCRKYGYLKKEDDKFVLHGAILPGSYVDGKINGQSTVLIEFYKPSPLFAAAEIKNGQILTYDKELLDIPIKNSPEVIVIKSYVLRRILEIISHNMQPTITFDDVFEKNQLDSSTAMQKKRFRDYMIQMFEYWKSIAIISEYNVNKRGHIPISISFKYPPPIPQIKSPKRKK